MAINTHVPSVYLLFSCRNGYTQKLTRDMSKVVTVFSLESGRVSKIEEGKNEGALVCLLNKVSTRLIDCLLFYILFENFNSSPFPVN